MSYVVTYQGKEVKASVERSRPGIYKVLFDGTQHEVDFLEPQPDLYSLIIEGKSYEADVDAHEGSDKIWVGILGNCFEVEVVEEKKKLGPALASGLFGRQEIKSPMAGNVKKVFVHEGERVEAGHVLIILEAMKMENQVKAPVAGTVVSVSASEGIPVAPGDLLCALEPPA